MNKKLLDIIVCPVCKGKLTHELEGAAPERLVCRWDKLAYPVHDGIPVLIENQAQPWSPALDETKK